VRVVLLHLGRPSAYGEARRLATWEAIIGAAGGTTERVALLPLRRRIPGAGDVRAVVRGAAVPETLAWSAQRALQRIRALDADAVICVTARAYHPLIARHVPVVLDYVDILSTSYADRATIVRQPMRRVLFSVLARSARRFEARQHPHVRATVAAGWAEARATGSAWVPLVIPEMPEPASQPDVDVLFFGNLSYPPNIAAVRRLAAMWPALQARRPGTTLALAGATPPAEVRATAGQNGWQLWADFASVPETVHRARVAVAPLDHVSGIQTKVLEAAALGVPQVVAPAVLAGVAPGFPAVMASDDEEFVDAVVRLLDDADARAELAMRARQHMRVEYSAERWVATTLGLLDAALGPRAAPLVPVAPG
jgi:glycosyltransferase involved in cell wall biosynthesis